MSRRDTAGAGELRVGLTVAESGMTLKSEKSVCTTAVRELFRENGLFPPEALHPPDAPFPVVRRATFDSRLEHHPYFADVELSVQWTVEGEEKALRVRSNIGGHGSVGLVVCGRKILLLRQWRVALGRYTWEVPRGMTDPQKDGQTIALDVMPQSLKTALREAREELGVSFTGVSPRYLGSIAENSGNYTGSPSYWLLEVSDFPASTNPLIRFRSIEDAVAEVEDNHSAAALILYQRWLARQGALRFSVEQKQTARE